MFGWFKNRQSKSEPERGIGTLIAEARALRERGDMDGALRVIQKLELLGRKSGEAGLELLQNTLVWQATILHQRNDLVRAAALYEEASQLLFDDELVPLCLEKLQEIHGRVNGLERALELHRRHNWDWRKEGNPNELCVSLANRGVALAAGGDFDGAVSLFERLEQVCRELPSYPGLAIALGNQAESHTAKGDRSRALILYREQERLCAVLGNPEGVARSQAKQHEILGSMRGGQQTPQGAVALIEMLGGRVEIDETQADTPVVGVTLRGSRVKNADLALLKGMGQLRELDLGETDIGDVGLAHVAQLPGLKTLVLQLTMVTDHGIEHLQGLQQLQVLFLGGTKITDASLAYLRKMSKLEILILGGTGVTDAGLADLRGNKSLWNLDLRDTRVTDEGLSYLKELTRLKKINLFRTQVTEQGVAGLRRELPEAAEILC